MPTPHEQAGIHAPPRAALGPSTTSVLTSDRHSVVASRYPFYSVILSAPLTMDSTVAREHQGRRLHGFGVVDFPPADLNGG